MDTDMWTNAFRKIIVLIFQDNSCKSGQISWREAACAGEHLFGSQHPSHKSTEEGNQGRGSSRRGDGTRRRMLLTGLLNWLVYLPVQETTCPGMPLPTAGQACPHQQLVKKKKFLRHSHSQSAGGSSWTGVPLPKYVYVCVNRIKLTGTPMKHTHKNCLSQ